VLSVETSFAGESRGLGIFKLVPKLKRQKLMLGHQIAWDKH